MEKGVQKVQVKLGIDEFEFKICNIHDLKKILDIQNEAFSLLEDHTLLRKNTPEMLSECLELPNITIGAWYNGELAAFSVLYFPTADSETLALSLSEPKNRALKSANYKLCIVKSKFRGNSLQYELGKRLLEYAADADIQIVCVTASPLNTHSVRNIERLGYVYDRTLKKYGFERNLYYKKLK